MTRPPARTDSRDGGDSEAGEDAETDARVAGRLWSPAGAEWDVSEFLIRDDPADVGAEVDAGAGSGPGSGSPASDFAVSLLQALVAGGMREVVVCPGSRSQALALAAAELAASGRIRVHVRIDERVAGFTALGLAVESGLPVGVVVTSGTAVANLHPAVLEAYHSTVPIVLLTADRPDELRGTGSNQTTEQRGVFGRLITTLEIAAPTGGAGDADAAARFADIALSIAARGPAHVNVSFREPLSAAGRSSAEAEDGAARGAGATGAADADAAGAVTGAVPPFALAVRSERPTMTIAPAPGTVVVAGHAAGEQAETLARALGAPLLAEVSSGARFGPNLVPAYAQLLREEGFGDEVRRAIVLGHPTLTREIPLLLRRDDVEVLVLDPTGAEPIDPGHRARVVGGLQLDGEPDPEWARPWVGRWVRASRLLTAVDEPSTTGLSMAEFARHELEAVRAPIDRRALVEAVWSATWPHDRLVIGASRLIRVADAVVPGKRIRVHANRGLAGIDGTVSTAIGIALAAEAAEEADGRGPRGGTTRVLLGDLALLHDAGGLLLGDGEPHPRLQVIVGNDHGGTIFDTLEVAGSAEPEVFDRVFLTPQHVDLERLAGAYGWGYRRASTRGELGQVLSAPAAGPELVEVPLAR